MERLKQALLALNDRCRKSEKRLENMYRIKQEQMILDYVKTNLKEDTVMWLYDGKTQQLRFRRIEDNKIIFYNKTVDKEESFTPFAFMALSYV